ncbi:MAG: phosphoribosylformylglycinamidine synthase I [Acidobacteria bacterium]|nr:MAG: phosphoribosylformylglycinamidine synthase I [Acidobacteriota bacterium]
MKFAIVVFPGSNCDHDAYHAARDVLGQNADYVWHKDTDLKGADVVILPGGFAHGDYLRCGAMARFSPIMREVQAKFQCEHVHIRVEQTDTPFTLACRRGQVLRIPIAHGEGNYFAEPEVIARLEANRQIVFRYTNAAGAVVDDANPNGSAAAIAGLCNETRNVVGLMPHPERACEPVLGSADGLLIFESAVAALKTGVLGGSTRSALEAVG